MRATTLMFLLAAGCATDLPPDVAETPRVSAVDADGDGYTTDDCNDNDSTIHPDAQERCDGIDNNCDGSLDDLVDWFVDADGDRFGTGEPVAACEQPPGYADVAGDCDDAARSIHPNAVDHCGDGVDTDCSGDERGLFTRWRYTDVEAGAVADPTPLAELVDGQTYFHDDTPSILAICDGTLPVHVDVSEGLLVIAGMTAGATWTPPAGVGAAAITGGRLYVNNVDVVDASPAKDVPVFSCVDGDFDVVDSQFEGWSTQGSGAGLALEACAGWIERVEMTSYSGEDGAMIELGAGAIIAIDGSRFTDGSATDVVGVRYLDGARGLSFRNTVFERNRGQAVLQTAPSNHLSCGATDPSIDSGFVNNDAAAIRLHWNEGGGGLNVYLNRCDFGEGERDNTADVVFADGTVHSQLGDDVGDGFRR